jgi:hypothetical protein
LLKTGIIVILAAPLLTLSGASTSTETRVSINIVGNNSRSLAAAPAGKFDAAHLAIVRASLSASAIAADSLHQLRYSHSDLAAQQGLSRQQLDACFRHLPASYRNLHGARFAAAWPGAAACELQVKLIRNWQRLNPLIC